MSPSVWKRVDGVRGMKLKDDDTGTLDSGYYPFLRPYKSPATLGPSLRSKATLAINDAYGHCC